MTTLSNPTGLLNVEVVAARRVADAVVSVTLAAGDGGCLPGWSPGDHIQLWNDAGGYGRFSLCGAPGQPTWRIVAAADRSATAGLRPGAMMRVSLPVQSFVLVPSEDYLFVAGGIGIAPILPMAAEVHRRGRVWRLVFLGRTRSAMPYLDELEGYGDAISVFPKDEGTRFDADDFVRRAGAGTAVYCCGPRRLTAAVRNAARRRGRLVHMDQLAAPTPVERIEEIR